MYITAVLTALILGLASAFLYARLTWKRTISPVPATWILMVAMMSLSLWMYWHSDRKSLTANIGIIVGIINCTTILAAILVTNWWHKTFAIAFDKTQKRCLLGGLGIFGFWLFTDHPFISYILVQLIALVAYFATVKRLRTLQTTTEPLFLWVSVLIANLCAIYPAWVKQDPYSWIYLARALPSTLFIIILIARIKQRMKRVSASPELA